MKEFFNKHPFISLIMVFGFYMTASDIARVISGNNNDQSQLKVVMVPIKKKETEDNKINPETQEG